MLPFLLAGMLMIGGHSDAVGGSNGKETPDRFEHQPSWEAHASG
jgi:hypothetical protein